MNRPNQKRWARILAVDPNAKKRFAVGRQGWTVTVKGKQFKGRTQREAMDAVEVPTAEARS